MPQKDETIDINSGMNVRSIQITINLGQPTDEPDAQPADAEAGAAVPAGTLVRQVLPDPNDNTQKKVRVTFVPDDSTQNISINIKAPDIGDKGKWVELLGDPPNVEIDAGITLLRFSTTGGVTTWLPDDLNENIVNHVFKQKTPHEPGGVSVAEFIACWIANGGDAAAAAACWDQL